MFIEPCDSKWRNQQAELATILIDLRGACSQSRAKRSPPVERCLACEAVVTKGNREAKVITLALDAATFASFTRNRAQLDYVPG
jgi:16S rRNA U1498 N3-methylase RsmE